MFARQMLPQSSSQICHQCRRTISSSAPKAAFTDLIKEDVRTQNQRPSQSSPALRNGNDQAAQRTAAARQMLDPLAMSRRIIQEGPGVHQNKIDLEKQMTRRWKVGDVYAPHDLSGAEMSKWKKTQNKGRPNKDVFDVLKINPLDQYKNFAMMGEYMTEMGRIKNITETGLRPVNQRRVAKAVRRAVGLGLMPSVHRHPELLRGNYANLNVDKYRR